jgi:hypothetical protein
MILLKPELFSALNVGGLTAVCDAARSAIKLEHSTIPLYLYAMYSLDRTKNPAIASAIKTVALEEMLHMALGCNILNALGQDPMIDNPDFVPKYPGALPGGVESDLTVHLAPFSVDQLQVFLQIEEPEMPLKFRDAALATTQPALTIGRFYRNLQQQIIALGDKEFAKGPRNQIGPEDLDNAVIVTNAKTACDAIDLIVDQGEGTAESPQEVFGGMGVAHFYRFSEILHRHKLKPNPKASPTSPPHEKFIYAGDPVPFDTSGVFPAPTDPKAANYPAGSPARVSVDMFNTTYTKILKSLQTSFTGNPGELQNAIFTLMPALGVQARKIFSLNNPDGTKVGPSFEYASDS